MYYEGFFEEYYDASNPENELYFERRFSMKNTRLLVQCVYLLISLYLTVITNNIIFINQINRITYIMLINHINHVIYKFINCINIT